MEVEVMLSGIGGQGVQLVAKTLAVAALQEERYVMLSSDIGGEMRGGLSVCSLAIGDAPIKSLPILTKAASALIYHHKFSDKIIANLRKKSLVMINDSIYVGKPLGEDLQVWKVSATEIASAMGQPLTAGFVMLGAYNKVAGLVGADSLNGAMHEVVPPYRKQYIEANLAALKAGADSIEHPTVSLWEGKSSLMEALA